MASVIDVAKRAATSTATVSRVFNGSISVRPETRDKVIAAARELGYRPDTSARNLRRRRSGLETLKYTVGILFADSSIFATNPFNLELVAGVESALRERGFGIRIIIAGEGRVPQEVEAGDVDGVIVQGSLPLVAEVSRLVPTVTLDAYEPASDAYGILPDYRRGVREATTRLLASDHKRMALLCGPAEPGATFRFANQVTAGCAEACAQAGVSASACAQHDIIPDAAAGYRVGMALLSDAANRPDAIIASDGGMPGIYRAAAEHGLRIGEDLSLVGLDGVALGEYMVPALTTVDVGIHKLGAIATKVITECVSRGETRRGMEIVPVTLMERASARF